MRLLAAHLLVHAACCPHAAMPVASSCLLAFAWLLSASLVQVQAVPKASGVKAKVQAATAPLQQASTAKQPAVDAAAAVVSAGASSTCDKEVQVRKAASVLAPPA